ncbi:MAG TPA: hypothetical protein VFO46_02300 [Candidatus Sulfotelmatobacter sp.]|nr:hypothetical protein [Candidatus Sulfotelmatobacter sp.]
MADRNTVRSMVACGFTHIQIARCIGTHGISDRTLRKHFRRELDTAADMSNASVGNIAYQRAMAGEPWAVCFWLKCRAGWREPPTSHRFVDEQDNDRPFSEPKQLLADRIAQIAEAPSDQEIPAKPNGHAG